MSTNVAPVVETKYKIRDLIRVVGTALQFAFGDKFKFLQVTWQNQIVRTYVLNAIAFASVEEIRAMPPAHVEKLMSILLWESKRFNGTWQDPKDGQYKGLRFADSLEDEENKHDRGEYWKRLNMAIANLKRGGRPAPQPQS